MQEETERGLGTILKKRIFGSHNPRGQRAADAGRDGSGWSEEPVVREEEWGGCGNPSFVVKKNWAHTTAVAASDGPP